VPGRVGRKDPCSNAWDKINDSHPARGFHPGREQNPAYRLIVDFFLIFLSIIYTNPNFLPWYYGSFSA
jgi:hypothetical protein